MVEVRIPEPEEIHLRQWSDLTLAHLLRWPEEPFGALVHSGGSNGGGPAEVRFACPLHGSDHQPSLCVHWADDDSRGTWRCHACGRSGRMDPDSMPDDPPPVVGFPGGKAARGSGGRDPNWHFEYGTLEEHAECLTYLIERGFGIGAYDLVRLLGPSRWSGAMAPRDRGEFSSSRLQIALWLDPAHKRRDCSDTGRPYWAGRALDGAEPKWFRSKGSSGFICPWIPSDADTLVVVEGGMDVLAVLLLSALPDAAAILPPELAGAWPVGIIGCYARAAVAQAFVERPGRLPRRVLVALDGDEAGERGVAGVMESFARAGALEVSAVGGHWLRGADDPAALWARDYAQRWADRAARLANGRWPVVYPDPDVEIVTLPTDL